MFISVFNSLFDYVLNKNYIKSLVLKKVVILKITIFLTIINISSRLNILNIYNNKKNKSDYYKGYYIKNINTFLTVNNNEILMETIPNYSITNPDFSIIMAFYNRNDTITKAITSIQNQKFKSYEILLIDDKSTDNSFDIVNDLSKMDKRIKLIRNKEKLGTFLSKLIGVILSRGDLITFLDSDDMYTSNNVLTKLYNLIKIYEADTIEFMYIYGKIGNYTKMANFGKKQIKIINGTNIITYRYRKKRARKLPGYMSNKLIKRKTINKVMNYLENKIGLNILKNWNIAEDQYFVDLTMIFSQKFLQINEIYYFYYKNPKSATNNRNLTETFQGYYNYIHYLIRLIKQYHLDFDILMSNVNIFFTKSKVLSNYTKNECIQISNLTEEIKINQENMSYFSLDKLVNFMNKSIQLCS